MREHAIHEALSKKEDAAKESAQEEAKKAAKDDQAKANEAQSKADREHFFFSLAF